MNDQHLCANCSKNGHHCAAIDIDYAPGDVSLCAFCEDGIACPVTQRQVDPATKDRPAHKPMLQGDVLRNVKVSVHSDKSVSEHTRAALAQTVVAAATQFIPREELSMEQKKDFQCRYPRCGNGITERNHDSGSGCCATHCGWAKKNPRGKQIAGGKWQSSLSLNPPRPPRRQGWQRSAIAPLRR